MYEEIRNIILNNENFEIYKVEEKSISESEKRMGIIFPEDIRSFYLEIGYGFVSNTLRNINRIMAPEDVADFVTETDFYEYIDKSVYDEDSFAIFHVTGEDYLTYKFFGSNKGVIMYFDRVIADSFMSFIKKLIDNPCFYME